MKASLAPDFYSIPIQVEEAKELIPAESLVIGSTVIPRSFIHAIVFRMLRLWLSPAT